MSSEQFDATIAEWRRYQAQNAGRLRTELLWRGLQPHLPTQPSLVLDLGGGGGELAARLAHAGHSVTLVDYSRAMLDFARENIGNQDVTLICADVNADDVELPADRYDVVLCHSVLEFVDRPSDVLARCARWTSEGGLLSVAFGNHRYAALKTAIVEGDLTRARHDLHHPLETKDCFGLPKRLFEPAAVNRMLATHGLVTRAHYGIRVVTDLLEPEISAAAENFEALLALEADMMAMPAYVQIARYVQMIAQSVSG